MVTVDRTRRDTPTNATDVTETQITQTWVHDSTPIEEGRGWRNREHNSLTNAPVHDLTPVDGARSVAPPSTGLTCLGSATSAPFTHTNHLLQSDLS
jgi:hypothetical protein